MSDNIKVVVKVRPLISREVEDKLTPRWRVKSNTLVQLDPNGQTTDVKFTFDRVYDECTKTEEVYNDIAKPIVEAAIAGFNGTIFAYGQTSSGKTFTMSGTENSKGIIPLAVLNIFEIIKQKKDRDFLVRVSYIEIYNETVKDLLNVEKKNIKIHDTVQGVKVDCTEKVTGSPEEVLDIMKEGEANRQTGATNMNEESSRSHSIFQITIESREHVDGEDEESGCVNVSQLNLVDLAGSERSGQTGATGIRFKEGTHINKSLSSLALVIKQLSEDPNKFANYRDSKLTRILQNSLGGNAKTSIICAITPASVEETHSTLQFANRAKCIKNKPEVNAVATNATMIQSLTKQLSKLQSELAAKRNLEVMLESSKNVEQELQNKIANLQKVILNGLTQRSSIDVSGRRKAAAPRRMTISTLHNIEEEPVPAVPRFCTPSLKYNPLCLPEMTPLQSGAGARLQPVPEETRMLTPPPIERQLSEIIEINSDDDSFTEPRCSPYHKCYSSSKTPPCVLRKTAKQAEKNLQDIVELTDREKIYTPNVVELLEKLDSNANIIAQLQEEIDTLRENSKEKDSRIEELTTKVNETEKNVLVINSAKLDLEIKCAEHETKLTDWEVTYETLRNKSKTRETELLSLLHDQEQLNQRKREGNPKKMESEMLNFMDMSKDISLLNSDNESIKSDGTSQIQEIVSNVQSELSVKTQNIVELEASIFAQKRKIESLTSSSLQMQATIDELNNKLSEIELENSFLKNSVQTLNNTVENQKQCLETAEKDIKSYTSAIQELQIQLMKKDNILNTKVNDSLIDSMIANEENIIANNDNIRNIIHSLKKVLQKKKDENKEISANNDTLKQQLEKKENELSTLIEQAESYKDQLGENNSVITKLMKVEEDLTNQIRAMQEINETLHMQNSENVIKMENLQQINSNNKTLIENLQINNDTLTQKIAEKEVNEQNLSSRNIELSNRIEAMIHKNSDLEKALTQTKTDLEDVTRKLTDKEINEESITSKFEELGQQIQDMTKKIYDLEHEKNKIIDANTITEKAAQEQMSKAKIILKHLHEVILNLEGKTEDFSESTEDLSEVLEILLTKIKDLDVSVNNSLHTIKDLTDQSSILHLEIERLNKEKAAQSEKKSLETFNLMQELEDTRNDIKSKEQKIIELQDKLNNAVSINENAGFKENIDAANLILLKLLGIIMKLNEHNNHVPKRIDNIQELLESLDYNLNNLNSLVIEKLQIVTNLEDKLIKLTNDNKSAIALLEEQLGKINSEVEIKSEEIQQLRADFVTKEKELVELEIKLNEVKENNENLRNDILSKDNSIVLLHEQLNSLYLESRKIATLEDLVNEKSAQVLRLEEQLANIGHTLEEKYKDVTNALTEAIQKRDKLLAEILKKAVRVARQCGGDNNEHSENYADNVYEQVVLILDKIGMSIAMLMTENDVERSDIENMLSDANMEIEKLTDSNIKLMNKYKESVEENRKLLIELEQMRNVNGELLDSSESLKQINMEILRKSSEMKIADQINKSLIDSSYQQKFCRCLPYVIYESSSRTFTPKSLSTISLNKILDTIQQSDQDMPALTSSLSASTTIQSSNSKFCYQVESTETQTDRCDCNRLVLELHKAEEENKNLVQNLNNVTEEKKEIQGLLRELQAANDYLLMEREEVRKEIQSLTEPAKELQKKIVNHRTNLSTLTATTYAENKLLNSRLKVLEHHHTRSIHVCQRDLPVFKSQLNELMTILKENAFVDKQNSSFKRYSLPDVLESETPELKNEESILDGDLLMLDTNITLTTVNNTLVGHDQTCLDVTQVNFDGNETECLTNNTSKLNDPCLIYSQMETLSNENLKLSKELETLRQEYHTLKEEIMKNAAVSSCYKDAQNSPIKLNGENESHIYNTFTDTRYCELCYKLKEELRNLDENLNAIKAEKDEIQEKLTNITLEMPSTEALVRKLSQAENENIAKTHEINKITNELNKKNKIIKDLQEENDTLSGQVMDTISEADSLKKELDDITNTNNKLIGKCKDLQLMAEEYELKLNSNITCSQCCKKDDMIKALQLEHSKLNRSFSDSESSSRLNKICTLQNELHASKEDCKKITEEVATIKNHLELSNTSVCQAMDLDESMKDTSILQLSVDLNNGEQSLKSIPHHQIIDMYTTERMDCFKFFVEKIGSEKVSLNKDDKIINIMKMLHNSLLTKHGNEIDNLLNQLKDLEESKNQLQSQLSHASSEYSKVTKELEENQNHIKTITNVLNKVRANVKTIQQEMTNSINEDVSEKIVPLLKENFLGLLDSELGLSCADMFDTLINKQKGDASKIMTQYTKLQSLKESVGKELNDVNENLKQVKCQLTNAEEGYNLLKAQKEKLHEISKAVTLDIVQREEELTDIIDTAYEKLVESHLIIPFNIESSLLISEKLRLLFENVISNQKLTQNDEEKKILLTQIHNLETTITEKEKIASKLTETLSSKEMELQTLKSHHEELSKLYQNKIEENETHLKTIENIAKEVIMLKEEMFNKEINKSDIPVKKCDSCIEMIAKIENLNQEFVQIKAVNDMITKEKETYALELEKAREVIAKNKIEIDKMTADILVLRESINDNVSVVESLTLEAKSLLEQNVQLKKQFDEKNLECLRLETNIKTHEKTAEIQSKMIMKIQKQKEEDNKLANIKDKQIEDLMEKCAALQNECDQLKDDLKTAREEVDKLKNTKDCLEAKICELEINLAQSGLKQRQSIDGKAEASLRRRQSMHDAKRGLMEEFNECKAEDVFGARPNPDDLFMDVDDDGSNRGSSNRSTPSRLNRGRDSLLARHDHDDSSPPRPSSVAESRRRRQSLHDQHRNSLQPSTVTPDVLRRVKESDNKPSMSAGDSCADEVADLRDRLASTQRELNDIKQRYQELDEECETCAQYLQETDERCRRLKKEKTALEHQVAELNEKLKFNANKSELRASVAHAAVNTDEDWANLHSVVVDRMSFDAEVEKNKKLSRTIEELRCNKQELKNTIAKMQRSLEKNAAFVHSKELDATKAELVAVRRELAELRERCRELDDECETCAQYLRERDEQCRKLREAKLALEKKLEEFQGEVNSGASASRRRRQSVHDSNRSPHPAPPADRGTDTCDDLLSYQVERDDSALRSSNSQSELQRVKLALEKVTREKAALEAHMAAAPVYVATGSAIVQVTREKAALEAHMAAAPVYVATGSAIVQNQQITDVMKENQKLKKLNAKLINICKKRGKSFDNRENEEPSDLG